MDMQSKEYAKGQEPDGVDGVVASRLTAMRAVRRAFRPLVQAGGINKSDGDARAKTGLGFHWPGNVSFGPHQSGDLETPGVGTPADQETSRLIIPTIFHVDGSQSTANANLVTHDLTHRRVTANRAHLHDQVELDRIALRILLRNGAPTYFHIAVE